MNRVRGYLEQIELRLLTDPCVKSFEVMRKREVEGAGYLRVRAILSNDDRVELAEYFEVSVDGIRTVDHRHQWMSPDGSFKARWDSTPHFPSLPGFPHHLHDGSEDHVVPAHSLSIFSVLDELGRRLGSQENQRKSSLIYPLPQQAVRRYRHDRPQRV